MLRERGVNLSIKQLVNTSKDTDMLRLHAVRGTQRKHVHPGFCHQIVSNYACSKGLEGYDFTLTFKLIWSITVVHLRLRVASHYLLDLLQQQLKLLNGDGGFDACLPHFRNHFFEELPTI